MGLQLFRNHSATAILLAAQLAVAAVSQEAVAQHLVSQEAESADVSYYSPRTPSRPLNGWDGDEANHPAELASFTTETLDPCDKPADPCGKKKAKGSPCAKSHKGLFYANDFSYLNDPNYCGCCLGDSLKQLQVGCDGKLDLGGQFRMRYHHEEGMNKGAQRFLPNQDDFLLTRLRLYANYA
ncbi:MAG: hypothetical protein N2C14_08100, partial [Planctomycetales bacterium]